MTYQEFFEAGKLLFERFGWGSVVLVILTTAIMIPLNLLLKKLMNKDGLSRLRKSISAVLVFVVALGVVAFFTGVWLKQPLTIEYLCSSSINCGILAMLLWGVIKIVLDYGWAPIWEAVLANKEAKAWLKEVGISNKLVDAVTDKVKSYMKEKKILTLEEYLQKESEIIGQLRLQVAGFVTSENVHKTITNILQPIKKKLK